MSTKTNEGIIVKKLLGAYRGILGVGGWGLMQSVELYGTDLLTVHLFIVHTRHQVQIQVPATPHKVNEVVFYSTP